MSHSFGTIVFQLVAVVAICALYARSEYRRGYAEAMDYCSKQLNKLTDEVRK